MPWLCSGQVSPHSVRPPLSGLNRSDSALLDHVRVGCRDAPRPSPHRNTGPRRRALCMSGVLPICDPGTTSRVLLPSRLWGRDWNRRKTKLRLRFDVPFPHPRRWAAGTLQGKGTERNQSGRAGKRKTLREQTESQRGRCSWAPKEASQPRSSLRPPSVRHPQTQPSALTAFLLQTRRAAASSESPNPPSHADFRSLEQIRPKNKTTWNQDVEKYFEIAYGCFWKVISANTKRLRSAAGSLSQAWGRAPSHPGRR